MRKVLGVSGHEHLALMTGACPADGVGPLDAVSALATCATSLSRPISSYRSRKVRRAGRSSVADPALILQSVAGAVSPKPERARQGISPLPGEKVRDRLANDPRSRQSTTAGHLGESLQVLFWNVRERQHFDDESGVEVGDQSVTRKPGG